MAKVICIVSPMAAGKDSIFKGVVKKGNVVPIISITNRPMREGEVNGVEYNFVSNDEMDAYIWLDSFVERRSYIVADGSTWHYGILKESIDLTSNNVYLAIVDYKGLCELEEYINMPHTVTSIYIDCDRLTRKQRALNRERNTLTDTIIEEIDRRLADDDINVVAHKDKCCMVLRNQHNEDLQDCIDFIDRLANAYKIN